MTIKILHCPSCGSSDIREIGNGKYRCSYCDDSFSKQEYDEQIEKIEKALGGVVDKALFEKREEEIANIRHNLWDAVHEKNISSLNVLRWVAELKKYLPDDLRARFYEAANDKNSRKVNAFLDGLNVEESKSLGSEVVDFMLKSLESHNILPLKSFVERAFGNDKETRLKYITAVEDEAEKVIEGIYMTELPRDVFIAYSSKDDARVNEIVEELERNKIRCFVASRNLRHGKGAVENYDKELKTAMHNCKCVVFMSSVNSRDLDCDALKVELPYICDNERSMGRIEYILDEYGKETGSAAKILLKEFFSGQEFCRHTDDLIKRILPYKTKQTKEEDKPSVKYCLDCGAENPINAKHCCECTKNEFAETYEEYIKDKTRRELEAEYAAKLEAERKELDRIKQQLQEEAAKKAQEETARKERENAEKSERERKAKEAAKKAREEAEKAERERKAKEKEVRKAEEERKAKEKQCSPDYPTLDNYNKEEFKIEGTELKKYNGTLKTVKIPYGVESIGDRAFDGCKRLTCVKIPNSVKSIGECAFQSCSGLTSIEIPNSVEIIKVWAFQNCSSLTSITVDKGNTKYHSIGNCLIETASKKLVAACKNSIIPSDGSVESIGRFAFGSYCDITSIKIPWNVTSIGDWAFGCLSSLTSIDIPWTVRNIGYCAFCGCKSLKSIEIPNNNCWMSIGDDAFSDCSSLTSITIPNNVKSIGRYTFSACSSLKSIEISNSVTSIGEKAFDGCDNITKATLPTNAISYIPKSKLQKMTINGGSHISYGALSYCNNLTNITIPNSVESIEGEAFFGCSSLTSIEIPNSVKWIGDRVFSGCNSLTSIEIPKSMTSIGSYAFSNCSNLTSITYKGTKREWKKIKKGKDWKKEVNKSCKVYCTDGEMRI